MTSMIVSREVQKNMGGFTNYSSNLIILSPLLFLFKIIDEALWNL
jgi:hypothetical protein